MKKILSSILLVGALALAMFTAPEVQAQSYGPATILTGGTNNVLAATTNTYSRIITIDKQDVATVGFQVSLKFDASTTGIVPLTFYRSLDGSTFVTDNPLVISVPANGTTTVNYITNFTLSAQGYLKLVSVANTNATANLTNLTLKASFKR